MRRRFDFTPLGHPIWWGALALMLVNDNLLKGRGVVPGWLTGKLSDFAFLVVAPVVCAALLPRRLPGRRTFALAAVAGLFVAADLSRAASDAVVALAGRLGLTWRLWPDPTDLLALAVLPVTIRLLRRPPAPAGDGAVARRARSSRERAGVVLGALACIATSALPMVPQHPFLHNRTASDVAVRITWVLRKVDCATPPEALAATGAERSGRPAGDDAPVGRRGGAGRPPRAGDLARPPLRERHAVEHALQQQLRRRDPGNRRRGAGPDGHAEDVGGLRRRRLLLFGAGAGVGVRAAPRPETPPP